MKVKQWVCSNPSREDHIFYLHDSVTALVCPVCGAPNKTESSKLKWEQTPFYKWAKRKTSKG